MARREQWFWWALLAAALVLSSMGDAHYAPQADFYGALPWWLGALAVLLLAAWLGDRGRAGAGVRPWHRAEVIAVASVALVSVLLRVWRITAYPPSWGFAFEEFQTGGDAYRLLRDGTVALEFPLTNSLPALSFALFGFSSYALRLPFILSSALAPVFLFLAMRRLVSWPAAWGCAMMLAAARWPAAAARFADEIFFPIAVVALGLWLLVRAVQRRSQLDAFALALVSGELFYAYTGYRIFPLIVLAGSGLAAVIAWRRGAAPAGALRVFPLVIAIWAVLLGPGVASSGSYGASMFFEAFHRHADVRRYSAAGDSLGARLHAVVDFAREGAEVFYAKGDEIPSANIPLDPMLDPLTAALLGLSLLAALWRWRDLWRLWTMGAVAIPFAALCLVPTNLNVSRYFVLLLPMYALLGFFFDEVLGWRFPLRRWLTRLLVVLVAIVAAVNIAWLGRMMASPVVRESFAVAENLVLAEAHRVPPGSRVVMLTTDGSNAFEPSDYSWYVDGRIGSRPLSLSQALSVSGDTGQSIYWITQGDAEAALLPKLVTLECPDASSRLMLAPDPSAAVGVASIVWPDHCRQPPAVGLRGSYTVQAPSGEQKDVEQLDPALMAYTIPWVWASAIQDRQLAGLTAQWRGDLLPMGAGDYEIELALRGATGDLHVGDAVATIDTAAEEWRSTRLRVHLDAPAHLAVGLRAVPGIRPGVRLFWRPPGGARQLVPPQSLRPS